MPNAQCTIHLCSRIISWTYGYKSTKKSMHQPKWSQIKQSNLTKHCIGLFMYGQTSSHILELRLLPELKALMQSWNVISDLPQAISIMFLKKWILCSDTNTLRLWWDIKGSWLKPTINLEHLCSMAYWRQSQDMPSRRLLKSLLTRIDLLTTDPKKKLKHVPDRSQKH